MRSMAVTRQHMAVRELHGKEVQNLGKTNYVRGFSDQEEEKKTFKLAAFKLVPRFR